MACQNSNYCKYGCRHTVSPGTTQNGNAYDTCCRSCVKSKGANHDNHCIRRNKTDTAYSNNNHSNTNRQTNRQKHSNYCKYGCGKTVSPGTTPNGNAYDTCCRSCVKSKGRKHGYHCSKRNTNNNVVDSNNNNPNNNYQMNREKRLNSNIMTLYHLTDQNAANSILDSGYMRSGSDGLAGSGIYFATSVEHCKHKARKGRKEGIVLRCRVKVGNIKRISKNGEKCTFDGLLKQGYDSVLIPRDNGLEYVVYNKDQIERVGQEAKIQNYVQKPPPKYEYETAYAATQKMHDDLKKGALSYNNITDQEIQNALWNNDEDPADILSANIANSQCQNCIM